MYSRLVVLILVTVLFAGIWSQDHARKPIVAQPAEQTRVEEPCPPPPLPDDKKSDVETLWSWYRSFPVAWSRVVAASDRFNTAMQVRPSVDVQPVSLQQSTESHRNSVSQAGSVRTLSAIPVVGSVADLKLPLPNRITAGEYRVVEESGAVHRLVLTDAVIESLGQTTGHADRELYTVDLPEQRVYFIRVQASSDTPQADDSRDVVQEQRNAPAETDRRTELLLAWWQGQLEQSQAFVAARVERQKNTWVRMRAALLELGRLADGWTAETDATIDDGSEASSQAAGRVFLPRL